MNKLIISAPFGNYINYPGVTSTIGTYTLNSRGNLLTRIWKVLSTVRYSRKTESWINKLGLPNPGIRSLNQNKINDKILSIHGSTLSEWFCLLVYELKNTKIERIELNFSCPNVNPQLISEYVSVGKMANNIGITNKIIAKLPPVKWMNYIVPLRDVGISCFHLCNSIPTKNGGLSGKVLKQYSLWAVEEVKQKWGNDVKVIGGGGVTGVEDIDDYMKAGADHFSIGSMLFNPFNWKKLRIFRDYLEKNLLI